MRPTFPLCLPHPPPPRPRFLLQSPSRPLLFLAHQWEETAARGPVQGERRHMGLEPHVGAAAHASSPFRTEKCLAEAKCARDVGSHTESEGPGSEANCWPFPKGPAPFPVQCPHWGCAWDDQHLSGTGKDVVQWEKPVEPLDPVLWFWPWSRGSEREADFSKQPIRVTTTGM